VNFSSQNGVIWCILCVLFLRFTCPMDCSCMINFNRSTSLCLTNDTDWQVHVSANFEYITVSKLTSFKILGVVNTTQDDPCRSNSGGRDPCHGVDAYGYRCRT